MKTAAAALGVALFLLGTRAMAVPSEVPRQLPVEDSPVDHERAALIDVLKQSQQPTSDKAILLVSLKYIVADPAFGLLSEKEQHIAHLAYGVILFETKDYRNANTQAKISSVMADAEALDWDLRLNTAYRLQDYADALVAATKLAQNWPGRIPEYSDQTISVIVMESQKPPGNDDTPAAFLNALFDLKWHPRSPFYSGDDIWMTLLHLRLSHGDMAGAKAVAASLTDPVALIKLHAGKEFDGLIQQDPNRYHVASAYTAELTDLKSKAANAPDRLEGVNSVAWTLGELGRAQEEFDLVSDAIARSDANPKVFSDYDNKISRTEESRSEALFKLGRSEEAFAALQKGASLKEGGDPNVSQAIDLADEYNAFDRPKDALAAVGTLDFAHTTPYGRMALQDARACAYYELGDKDNLAKTLAYMKAHAVDGMQPYLNTMLWTGDLDGAASEVIAELNDPSRRDETLYFLQNYLPQPNATAREQAIHANWIAVRERPDVSAAIAKVGRIETYAVTSPSY